MYLRVFQDRTSKIIVYSLMAFIAAFTLPLTIYVIIQCIPGGEGSPLELFVKCHRNSPDLLTSAACNVLADVLLLIFIVPRIFRLKITSRQRIALVAVMSLSLLVIAAAIIRLFMVMRFNNSDDRTWDFANITTWSAVEVDTGLFCAAAPAIRPLIRKWTPRFMPSSREETTHTSNHQHYELSAFANRTRRSGGQCINDGNELGIPSRQKWPEARIGEIGKLWLPTNGTEEMQLDDRSSVGGILDEESAIGVTASIIAAENQEGSRNSRESRQSLTRMRFDSI